MLSIDISNSLSLLSAICNTPHVFMFRDIDAQPIFFSESETEKNDSLMKIKAISFKHCAEEISQSVNTNNPNVLICKSNVLSSRDKHSLYLCGLCIDVPADHQIKLPNIVLGICIADSVVLSEKTQAAVISLADMLRSQVLQGKQLRAVSQSEDLFKEISRLNKDYIYVKDASGKVIFANKAIINLFPNDTYYDIVDEKLQLLFEQKIEQSIDDVNEIVKRKGEHQREDYITHYDGRIMVLQTVTQRFHANDDSIYFLVVSRDVTEREVIIKDLKRSNQDLDNFAYVASHDLKAPLNVIKRLVSWVMEDCADLLPKDSLEDLELVMSRARRMEQLLQDMLSYARIGKEYQQATEVNVKAKVIELLSLIDLPMGFSVKCDDVSVKVPEVPFGVVLLNLIANAIKHHDSGNAKIHIKVRRSQTSNMITVMDNGPGIAEENRFRIFDLFETLKPRDEIEGSGMGLSVVKRLVEHYGGHIEVQDHLPRGTKFIVYWPFNNMAEQVLTQLG